MCHRHVRRRMALAVGLVWIGPSWGWTTTTPFTTTRKRPLSVAPSSVQKPLARRSIGIHRSNRDLKMARPYWQEFADTLLEGIDESFAEQQWYLPSIVEKTIIPESHDGLQDTNPYQLLQSLDMSDQTRDQALLALASSNSVQSVSTVLKPAECQILINHLNQHVHQQLDLDNVDHCPDWQVNLNDQELVDLIGTEAMDRLHHVTPEVQALIQSHRCLRVGIFLRVYQRGERPWMPWHSDGNAWTVNVALNDDADYQGGRLMALTNQQLQILERQRGDATVHKGSVYHAVSAMTGDRRRYSMILFFHEKS